MNSEIIIFFIMNIFTYQLFLFKFLFVFAAHLKFPFSKYLDGNSLSREKIAQTAFNNFIGISLELGVPPQKLTLSLEFYGDTILLLNPAKASLAPQQTGFYTNLSSTFKYTHGDYIQYLVKGYHSILILQAQDNFKFTLPNKAKKQTLNNFTFFLANNISDFPILSGIFGLDIKNDEFKVIPNHESSFSQLKKNNLISHEIFTIDYEKNYFGNLIIGDYPHLIYPERFADSVYTTKRINSNGIGDYIWSIDMNNISYVYEGKVYYTSRLKEVQFRIELGVIKAPNDFESVLLSNLKVRSAFKNGSCNFKEATDTVSYKLIICDDSVQGSELIGDLVFQLGDHKITLTHEDLFVKAHFKKKILQMAFFDGQGTVSIDEWVLGEPFFRKNTMVFDFEKRNIGFYFKGKGKKFGYCRAVYILVSIILILGAFENLFFLYHKYFY